ncbi:MAG TPA: hypothetical protein DIT05_13415 [Morganella sp. (in: Bacteria)]|nr:hypothetical protein [Morganella sp. (in: enterobacteria)]
MRKVLLGLLLSSAVFGLSAKAIAHVADNSPAAGGGFISQSSQIINVSQANDLPNDSYVMVEGYIVRNVSHNLYEFKDDSGITRVKIDNKKWNGLNISPDVKIKIEGKIDNHLIQHEINVEKVSLAAK